MIGCSVIVVVALVMETPLVALFLWQSVGPEAFQWLRLVEMMAYSALLDWIASEASIQRRHDPRDALHSGRLRPSRVYIRHAQTDDLPALVAILNAAIARRQNALLAPVTTESRARWLDSHAPEAYPLWVASRDAGGVAGWCSLSPWRSGRGALASTAEISVYIAPDRQRQGVGTALLRHAIDAAPEAGVDRLLAIGLESNGDSLALFTREGFSRWGTLPDVAQFGDQRVGQWILGRGV